MLTWLNGTGVKEEASKVKITSLMLQKYHHW
jgi:hypothetical protein